MSLRDFAEHLGVSERTVSKWESGQGNVHPRPEMQAALDTTLSRTDQAAIRRFTAIAGTAHHDLPQANLAETTELAVLARQEISTARQTLALSHQEFAGVLAPLLRWIPSTEMIESWETSQVPPGDVLMAARLVTNDPQPARATRALDPVNGAHADVTAVYSSRAAFVTDLPPEKLISGARDVRAVGLSLNLLCQDYPDHRWADLMESNAHVRCLFLDPDGSFIKARETEEGFPAGSLSALTRVNIATLVRVRERLRADLQDRFEISVYDETLRFNITLVDEICIAQPYLPRSRGINSPTFVIHHRPPASGLYTVFEQLFAAQWERGRQL